MLEPGPSLSIAAPSLHPCQFLLPWISTKAWGKMPGWDVDVHLVLPALLREGWRPLEMGQAAQWWCLRHCGRICSSTSTKTTNFCWFPKDRVYSEGVTSDFAWNRTNVREGKQTFWSIISQATHFTECWYRKLQKREAKASCRDNTASAGNQSGVWERGFGCCSSKGWTQWKTHSAIKHNQVPNLCLRILNIFSTGSFLLFSEDHKVMRHFR